MTLFIDNFTITGNADELVEFVKKYNARSTVAGNIGDFPNVEVGSDFKELWYKLGGHASTAGAFEKRNYIDIAAIPGTETFPEIVNDLICFYEGRPIKSMSDEELKDAIRTIISKVEKACDLDDLSHDELVNLLITYAPTNFGNLQNNE